MSKEDNKVNWETALEVSFFFHFRINIIIYKYVEEILVEKNNGKKIRKLSLTFRQLGECIE